VRTVTQRSPPYFPKDVTEAKVPSNFLSTRNGAPGHLYTSPANSAPSLRETFGMHAAQTSKRTGPPDILRLTSHGCIHTGSTAGRNWLGTAIPRMSQRGRRHRRSRLDILRERRNAARPSLRYACAPVPSPQLPRRRRTCRHSPLAASLRARPASRSLQADPPRSE